MVQDLDQLWDIFMKSNDDGDFHLHRAQALIETVRQAFAGEQREAITTTLEIALDELERVRADVRAFGEAFLAMRSLSTGSSTRH